MLALRRGRAGAALVAAVDRAVPAVRRVGDAAAAVVAVIRHPVWCAEGHRCGLGEHRSEPHLVDVGGAGRAVVTRVLGADGRQWAEVRVRLALSGAEPRARWQLVELLRWLGTTLHRAGPGRRRLWRY